MIGLLLGIIGTFFEEINNSIAKNKTKQHDIFKVGVISNFFGMFIFLIFGVYKYYFTNIEIYLNPESIPLLIVRLILEILQGFFTILAIKHCARSTYSIIRILTIPLLVMADIILGYQFTIYSIIGIFIILTSFLLFNIRTRTLDFTGWYFVLFTTINAVFTLSLFKYSITNYGNSVEVDQFIILLGILIFFLVYNYNKNKSCALKLILKEKQFLIYGLSIGISTFLISYSYLFLNASEATAIKRAGEMIWAILSGTLFFKEQKIIKKLIFALFLIFGLIIMTI